MDLRVAHPVPLAVQDVVPDLHVVEHLGDREARGAEHPGGLVPAREQERAAAHLELALHVDDASDVRRVPCAAIVEDRLPDGVELATDRLDVGSRQVRRPG